MPARSDLRKKLASGETIVAPGAYDPISARLVHSLGFDTIYTGGYMTGAHLAVTEPLMTMTEQVDVESTHFQVELPPGTEIRLKIGLERHVNEPSYVFPIM